MGTRAITKIKTEGKNSPTLLAIYTQFRGDFKEHGNNLKRFLEKITIVNGFGRETLNVANGVGCLAAQLIAHLKTKVGDHYIVSTDAEPEEFNYEISVEDGQIHLTGYNERDEVANFLPYAK